MRNFLHDKIYPYDYLFICLNVLIEKSNLNFFSFNYLLSESYDDAFVQMRKQTVLFGKNLRRVLLLSTGFNTIIYARTYSQQVIELIVNMFYNLLFTKLFFFLTFISWDGDENHLTKTVLDCWKYFWHVKIGDPCRNPKKPINLYEGLALRDNKLSFFIDWTDPDNSCFCC